MGSEEAGTIDSLVRNVRTINKQINEKFKSMKTSDEPAKELLHVDIKALRKKIKGIKKEMKTWPGYVKPQKKPKKNNPGHYTLKEKGELIAFVVDAMHNTAQQTSKHKKPHKWKSPPAQTGGGVPSEVTVTSQGNVASQIPGAAPFRPYLNSVY